MKIDKIRKIKALRNANLKLAYNEITHVISNILENSQMLISFNPHKVKLDGIDYIACDAKYINKITNQSGRGDYRYLIYGNELVGIAVHNNNGGYRKVV